MATPTEPHVSPELLAKIGKAALDHLAAVGHVASSWAAFEYFIDTYALQLGDIPREAGICLTAQIMGSARKLDAYIALARLKGADKLAGDLDVFAKETAKLAERRNRVVHDHWMIIAHGGKPHRLEATARRKLRHSFVPVETTELLKLATDIEGHVQWFEILHSRVRSGGTSPKKRQ